MWKVRLPFTPDAEAKEIFQELKVNEIVWKRWGISHGWIT
jgi:hypothetical protein